MFSIFSRRKKNREIFRYSDGTNTVGMDPLAAIRALHTHPEFVADVHPEAAAAGDAEAIEICLRTIREVFGVQAWSEAGGKEHGLTESETLNLLNEFGDWLERVKKNSKPMPTSPVATATTDAETKPEQTTNAGSDSGSTPSDPS